MNYSVKHLFHIDASKEKVFKAISSIEGLKNWWTVETSGKSELSGEIVFGFSPFAKHTFKVIEMESPNKLVWRCIDEEEGWKNHVYTFILDDNDGKTRVRFEHSGWKQQDDFYAICSFAWGRYMESLRQYCETGTGKAFGSKK